MCRGSRHWPGVHAGCCWSNTPTQRPRVHTRIHPNQQSQGHPKKKKRPGAQLERVGTQHKALSGAVRHPDPTLPLDASVRPGPHL